MLPDDLVAKLSQCAAHDFVGPRDSWFSWLARFTTMVFAGLVLEFPELRYELKLIARDWIPYFRYRIISPPERRLHAAKVLAFVGWFLIVVGVGGERYAEVRVKDLDTSIQECSDAKVRAATLEAGDAATSARIAHDEADAVKGIASAAMADAKDALVKARAAQSSLAQAERDAARAQAASSNALNKASRAESGIADVARQATEVSNRIAEAKKDVELLQSLVSARHVIDIQPLIDLKPLVTGKELFVESAAGEEESREFCSQIGDALQGATGMKFLGGCGAILAGIQGAGVLVSGPEAKRLSEALTKATGTPVHADDKPPTDDKVRIIVGGKPTFWFTKKK